MVLLLTATVNDACGVGGGGHPPCPVCYSWGYDDVLDEWGCYIWTCGNQQCCNGTCFDPSTTGCCNGVTYDLSSQACCGGAIQTKGGCMGCVNDNWVSLCDSSQCQTCGGNGICVSKCDPSQCQTCVNGNCPVCYPHKLNCCDDYDCYHCVEKSFGEICQPCLWKPWSYAVLMTCNRVDDPTFNPKTDGCSNPFGDHPNDPADCCAPDNSSFYWACYNHDFCYQTCGADKGGCDSAFGNDMEAVCAGTSLLCHVVCEAQRVIYWAAVSLCGEGPYESDQLDACVCCDCS